MLQLQQQWRGRLIDRSDGLLLLFERPIDGLGFALDYTRGLRALGNARNLELQARAGLHVGEVLTWRNSDEAVSVGAKPLEVEGLAKPMAARLMAMARPGQILLSAVAEPLAHRAARELGERGQHLLWKSYGRWRFKGVPEAQQIFEVGEPGVAPLRMPPKSTPRPGATFRCGGVPRRWRRKSRCWPGGALGAWFIDPARSRPSPSTSATGWWSATCATSPAQSVLDDSLEQAFRISLEQSRHVNVLSDLKARDTLARMQRAPDTVLDRAIASEIALRDGARAVILPTVAEVGGRVRVSAEVIDPHTQTTVYAESADGRGVDRRWIRSTRSPPPARQAGRGGEVDREGFRAAAAGHHQQPRCVAGVCAGAEGIGEGQYADALQLLPSARPSSTPIRAGLDRPDARALCALDAAPRRDRRCVRRSSCATTLPPREANVPGCMDRRVRCARRRLRTIGG